MKVSTSLTALAALAVLASCADKEVILEGERLAVRAPLFADALDANTATFAIEETVPVDASFEVPAVVANTSWTHLNGGPAHLGGNPAFGAAPQVIWSANIGQGNNRRHRITADPVIADGRVYALDSESRITAVSTAGATLWSRDLTPVSERSQDASGGGLAFEDGKIFATTGFGEVIALDGATGAEIWRQKLDSPATSSPAVLDGLVYVVSRDNRAWAIGAKDGRVKWQLAGTPGTTGVVGGAGPAVSDSVAVFPFGSGELVAALRQGGVRLWGAPISGKRRGPVYANISDITADPVIVDDVIYSANSSGRAAAISLNSGERIWTAREGSVGPVAVSGNSVFLVSDEARLVRLDATTGEQVWSRDLPYFKRETARRSKTIYAHFGPVMAGGKLWVASDDGTLKSYDPATGDERGTFDLPGGAASAPAVAGGTMYVLSGRGQLVAFR